MNRKTLKFRKGFRVALSSPRGQVAEMVLAAGDSEGDPTNRHKGSDQWLYVVQGNGTAFVNERRIALKPGCLLLIARGDRHEIKNTGRSLLRTLNFYVPCAYSDRGRPLPAARAS